MRASGEIILGFLRRFTAPKAKIELKLNEAVYETRDKMEGRILVDSQEDVEMSGFKLEFNPTATVKWKSGWSSFNESSGIEGTDIPVGEAVKLQKGQQYEQPFQVNIPFWSKPDPFTEIEVKVKAVATIEGRPDLTHQIQPVISCPYVIECLEDFGGCGFVTQPLSQPIETCPNCNRSLKDIWDQKYREMAKAMASNQRPMRTGRRI